MQPSASRGIVAGWDEASGRPKGVVSAADLRAALSMIADRPGIAYQDRAADITLSATSMAISWTAFNAVIPSHGGGWYTPRVADGTQTLAIGDQTHPRIDIIWVRQLDYESDASHPDSQVEVGVTRGTPSATPAPPAPPAGALVAFTVTVPRGATRGVDIGASGVVRAPWSYPPAPPAPEVPVSRDVTHLLTQVDTAGWVKPGDWRAHQVGKVVTVNIVLRGPWQGTSGWEEKKLLSIDPSIRPYYPDQSHGVMCQVPTSSGQACYLIANADVRLGVRGATSWGVNPVSMSWVVK